MWYCFLCVFMGGRGGGGGLLRDGRVGLFKHCKAIVRLVVFIFLSFWLYWIFFVIGLLDMHYEISSHKILFFS